MRTLRAGGRATAVAAAAVLLLSACTAGQDEPVPEESPVDMASEASSPAARATAGSSSPTVATRPGVGRCYDLDFDAATAPTNDDDPVSCRGRHTAQTYHVGRLDLVVDGHLLAVDSTRAQRQVQEQCTRQLVRHVGGTPRDRRLSRLQAVWFSPTIEQSDEGASWFRCDVVGLGQSSRLAPLPRPRELRGILDRENGLDEVGLCGTAAPGSPRFKRTICSQRHSWRALTTIDLDGGRYPGRAAVRRAGEDRCRGIVRRASGSPDRFRYGWEWPSRDQWRAGQRYGFCWAPD
ncbi:MAG TPA: septum formation family protein [Nocardioidaceae bacterium]